MWMLNSKGPNTYPCGTPLVREHQLENWSPSLTLWKRSLLRPLISRMNYQSNQVSYARDLVRIFKRNTIWKDSQKPVAAVFTILKLDFQMNFSKSIKNKNISLVLIVIHARKLIVRGFWVLLRTDWLWSVFIWVSKKMVLHQRRPIRSKSRTHSHAHVTRTPTFFRPCVHVITSSLIGSTDFPCPLWFA